MAGDWREVLTCTAGDAGDWRGRVNGYGALTGPGVWILDTPRANGGAGGTGEGVGTGEGL